MINKRIEVSSALNKIVGFLKKGFNQKPTPFITLHLQRTEVGNRARWLEEQKRHHRQHGDVQASGREGWSFCAHWPQRQDRGNGTRLRFCSLDLQPHEDATGKSKSDSILDLFL